ncbi:P-loop containing nucleoside triphosphate hydrolase protein [Armillaria novae-zelandiae]|uniref:P-loop containing nucleoside triphosphate hydrolase protein n=1 Tax=Armillaria novae-zelandiae TaxID=153914 RepID=A0AA39PKZ2_9AGAR|nr:P-loop containing nucleoside triphosphate hydrolase protein [Armillaria novae-zelandiae]
MPVGSGRSLAFFSAPHLDQEGLFIVVTPLMALAEDMGRRLGQNHAVHGGIYPQFSAQNGQLIFVVARHAEADRFLGWLEVQSSHLWHVFIDECHHIYLSTTYHACFHLFHRLTKLNKPFTFLSSTVLPQSIPLLCSAMGISQEMLQIICAPIARPNISYSITHIPEAENMLDVVMGFCHNFQLGPDDCGIIYSRTIADAKLLAEVLRCEYYASKVDLDEEINMGKKWAIIKRWQQGKGVANRWIVRTQCFGEGIDQSNVQITAHYNVMTLLDIIEQTG